MSIIAGLAHLGGRRPYRGGWHSRRCGWGTSATDLSCVAPCGSTRAPRSRGWRGRRWRGRGAPRPPRGTCRPCCSHWHTATTSQRTHASEPLKRWCRAHAICAHWMHDWPGYGLNKSSVQMHTITLVVFCFIFVQSHTINFNMTLLIENIAISASAMQQAHFNISWGRAHGECTGGCQCRVLTKSTTW